MVARAPVRVPVQPAVLGPGPASADHARATARGARAAARATRVLEIGPGTGYYTLPVAQRVGSSGRVHVFDVQQRDARPHDAPGTQPRASTTCSPCLGDARDLPYPAATFDAAYLVTVLGEIPDQEAALRQLRRVLRRGGRLVVGELFVDPHMVTERALRRRGEAAGLQFERRIGSRLGYFGVLRA